MTKYCPQCESSYEGVDFETCPDDGARLFRRSERPDDPLVGTVLDKRFRIDEPLSEGGMGAVYLATQLSVSRQVALKVVRSELDEDGPFIDRFFREAQVIADLSHPNIVRLIDFGQDEPRDILYLVMELVRGTEMGDVLAKGRLDPALAIQTANQICAGLTEPHSRGIVHRDLKPANIILVPSSDGTFQVKIVDFGIARTADGGTQLTKTGMICGTPAYLSPEQAQNLEVDARTDLYSLGVVLFEMLTGHLPFRGPSGLQLLMEHVQRPAPDLSAAYPGQIPAPIGDLVADLMAKDPDDRPAGAMDVRRRIQQIRRRLDLPPILLDDTPVSDDIEQVFSRWLLPELDLDRLDDPPDTTASGDDVVDSELAHARTLDTPAQHDSDLAHADTLATPTDTEAAQPDDEPESLAESDEQPAPSAGDPDHTDDTDTTDKPADEPERVDPPTAPPVEPAPPPRRILATLVALIVVLTAAVLFIVTGPLQDSDDPDPPDQPDETAALAQQLDEQPDDEQRDDADHEPAEGQPDEPQQQPEAQEPTQQPDEPTPQPDPPQQQDIPAEQPEEEAADPEQQLADVPDDAADDAIAEAVEDAPGSAQPPPPPAQLDEEPEGQVYEGSIVVETSAQLEAVQHYDAVTGDLVVRISTDDTAEAQLPNLNRIGGNLVVDPLARITSLSLPALESIRGSLMITQNEQLTRIEAPQLTTVAQNFQLAGTSLRTLELDELRQIGGMVSLTQNQALSSIELPAVQEVGASFTVMQNSHLDSLNIPRLRHIGDELQVLDAGVQTIQFDQLASVGGGVTFNDIQNLRVLDLGNLATIGMSAGADAGLILNDADRLEELDLSSLSQVNGAITMNSLHQLSNLNLGSLQQVGAQLTLTDNDTVDTIDLSSLTNVGTNLLINNHPELRDLSLSRVRNVDDLLVMNNPLLSSCELESLAEQLEDDGWDGEARLINLDDSGC